MRFKTTLATLAALSSAAVVQNSTTAETASRATTDAPPASHTLQAEDGFTTTRIFAPFNVGGAYITPIGSDGNTTTYGADVFSPVLASPTTSFTLGPNTAIHTRPLNGSSATDKNGQVYLNATTIENCAYTTGTNDQPMNAYCRETIMYVNQNFTSFAYATTNYPRPREETITLPAYNGNPVITGWDGRVDVYIGTSEDGKVSTPTAVAASTDESGNVVTSTKGAGGMQVTAMVQAVVVMAAGAAAMAV